MKIRTLLFVFLTLSLALAKTPAAGSFKHQMVMEKDLQWKPLAPGFEMAVVNGNPTAVGKEFVLRIRATQDNALAPAHWHPRDENITVLKGWFKLGEGDDADLAKAHEMRPGDFARMPGLIHHFGYAEKGSVVQVNGLGPFKVFWVKPPATATKEAKPKK